MRIVESEDIFFIKDVFPGNITAGFTKNSFKGVDVTADMRRVLENLNLAPQIAYLNQLHSSSIRYVNERGVYDGDGIFTNKYGLVLAIKTADCLPLFFWDEVSGRVGLIHLGWRGAKGGILNNLALNPVSSVVVAGVGLRKCCFCVGEEFLSYPVLASYLVDDKLLYFNPVAFAKDNLVTRGLKDDRFYDINICTLCGGQSFFSYRRDKTKNRTLSFIIKT